MAFLRGSAVPFEASEAHVIVEMEARPTLTELDGMPELLVEKILAYRAVKNVVLYGGEVKL